MQSENLFFVVPAIFATSILVGSDTKIEAHLPKSSSTINLAANASNAGMAALLGAGAGLFLLGEKNHDEHERETGFLAGEAAAGRLYRRHRLQIHCRASATRHR